MKRLLLAGLAIFALSANGAQAATLTAWQGSITIVSLTPALGACKNKGFDVGQLFHAVYRAQLDVGDPPAGLSVITSRSATILFDQTSNPTMKATNANYSAYLIGGRATTTSGNTPYTGTYTFIVQPATITAATKQVTVTGSVTNFFNTTGCTAKIEGSFFQRLD